MRRILLLVLILVFIASAILLERYDLLDLNTLRSHHSALLERFAQDPLSAYLLFSALLVFLVSFSIPGTLACMLFAGSAFKLSIAIVLVIVCRTIGGAVAFLFARYLARDWVKERFHGPVRRLDAGVEKEGWLYLLMLRLAPVLPDSVINPGMGLTAIGLRTFVVVSLLGMIPYVVLYTMAGQQLMQLASADEAVDLRWVLLLTVAALAVLLVKRVFDQRFSAQPGGQAGQS